MIDKVVNNMNVKNNPYTTVFGGLFILIGIALLIAPIFLVFKSPIPDSTGWWLLGVGGTLLFMPDKLFSIISKVADKKSDAI